MNINELRVRKRAPTLGLTNS